MKPKVLFVCDRRNWAFDITAQNLISQLYGQFDFDVAYVEEQTILYPEKYDLIYIFWWGERYHRKYLGLNPCLPVVKEISSHRWEVEPRFGRHTSLEAVERYMADADYLVATSRILENQFIGLGKPLFHYGLGVDTNIFFCKRNVKMSEITIGWAGNIEDTIKGVDEILIPACQGISPLRIAPGNLSQQQVSDFYNSLDVICVASAKEGTPLPLIEAMACGCFPVTCNVGVASEVIENGKNGLIVERDIDSFRKALDWCKDNLAYIREAGFRNIEFIKQNRTWDKSAEQFSHILWKILSENMSDKMVSKENQQSNREYNQVNSELFNKTNPSAYSECTYQCSKVHFVEELKSLLPEKKDVVILEIGTDHGHLLHFLLDSGYKRIIRVEVCKELVEKLIKKYGDKVERFELADTGEFLEKHHEAFDVIVMFDAIEHMNEDYARLVLTAAHGALKKDGRVILRTPNMCNIIGNNCLCQNFINRRCYSEWSLVHLMNQCGFKNAQLLVPKLSTWRRKWYYFINWFIHKYLYLINDKVFPKWVGKNIVVWASK